EHRSPKPKVGGSSPSCPAGVARRAAPVGPRFHRPDRGCAPARRNGSRAPVRGGIGRHPAPTGTDRCRSVPGDEGSGVAEEKDQETTNASASGDASPRQPYRSLLTRLHADGELDDAGYADLSAEVDAATTWGDLESAISGLDRGGLAVPTRRRQRRELPEEPTEPDSTGHTDRTDTDDEIDVDVDEDDVELDEDDEDLGVDEDVDDDELDLDEDETDDDESEDREAGELDDEADLD